MHRVRRPRPVTSAALRRWALPTPAADGDKNDRGTALVVGGSMEVPGALILSATAALRAGAGKLQLATPRPSAMALGIALPEAGVHGLPSSARGALGRAAGTAVARLAEHASAVLVGPGMLDATETRRFVSALAARGRSFGLVLDAVALTVLADRDHTFTAAGPAVLTPHAGEMATMMGVKKEDVDAAPGHYAAAAARRFEAVVALKGAHTVIATPDGDLFRYTGGRVGLATSGSGDVLAGIATGLLARGAEPAQAAAWAVFLHGEAGNVLVERSGPVGFLARELLVEIPRLMNATGARARRRR